MTIINDPFKGTFGNLENLVDKITEVLGCPVTIEDANHRLLAYSLHDDRTDPVRISTIIGRRVPEKVINNLWKDGVIPRLNQSDEPLRIPSVSDMGFSERVAISISQKGEVLGYIWVLENDNWLSEEQLSLLKLAAQTAKNQLLQLQVRKKKKEEGYQEFFWQLLTGHIKSHNEIKRKLEQLSIIPSFPIAILVFQFNEEINPKNEKHITYMITTTQQVKIPLHVIDRNELILLVTPLTAKDLQESIDKFITNFISHMEKRYKIQHIKGSCGNIYDNYEKVEASYQEALTVLRLKNKFPAEIGEIHNYHQLGIFRYLDVILEKNRLDKYKNPVLIQLLEYDKVNKTQFLETLEVFLNKDSNIHEAAKELHVHANTLNYRLKRISEICGVDFKNQNEKLTLYVDIKINKLLKEEHL
ncbi:PucR family transcriptional regulator [Anaerobacillus alkalidiazotrophicus]|uniref:PucR family transcriptional regulator n=1 Tax=Anaerobacillus alkalidiazotrophicus TaxID=472963 RepID=A0A1S2M739_9BACI|nr:PucR family transcriptional regulator [Anaerobacillus alkalidiazotrophicus]OIJ20531.1 PucR family transcriptional regulator [Anaerobacillus alkalidiazotrophicus]